MHTVFVPYVCMYVCMYVCTCCIHCVLCRVCQAINDVVHSYRICLWEKIFAEVLKLAQIDIFVRN